MVEPLVVDQVRVVVSTVETVLTVVVPILVVVLVLIVRIRFVAILLPATLPFGLVGEFGMVALVAVYVLLIGLLTLESEIKPTNNEQKSSSLVFPFELHIVALLQLLPTIVPSRNLRPHKRR